MFFEGFRFSQKAGLAALLILSANTAALAVPIYTIVDLGTLPAAPRQGTVTPIAINDAGQVIAQSSVRYSGYNSSYNGYIYSGGAWTNLDPNTVGRSFIPRGIANDGTVVGTAARNGLSHKHAVQYADGVVTDLGICELGCGSSGINNNAQVLGNRGLYGSSSAFIHDDTGTLLIGSLDGGDSSGLAINDLGHVAGQSDVGGDHHAFLYEGGVMHDLGTLGGRFSSGTDINNSDQVVGFSSFSSSGNHAFMYSGGVMIDLGTLGGLKSYAFAINDNGSIVGRSDFQMGDNDDHAFLWEDGTMYDLHDLIDPSDPLQGLTFWSAKDINSRGDILSSAFINGEIHAFVLRRFNPVPEPGALILIFLGLSLLTMMRISQTTKPTSATD